MVTKGELIRAEAEFTPAGLKVRMTLDVQTTIGDRTFSGAQTFEVENPELLAQVEQIVAGMIPAASASVGIPVTVRPNAEAVAVDAQPEGGQ